MESHRLKDGRVVLIREFRIEDKDQLIEMYSELSSEATRWAMPPYTKEVLERWLSSLQNLIILVALHSNRVVGHAQILKYQHARRKGTGDLIIYLHQDFHNAGLGTIMLQRLVELAQIAKLRRIGLHVIADNARAVHLYRKMGFKDEGTLKGSYLGEDGKYHDELVMAMLLK